MWMAQARSRRRISRKLLSRWDGANSKVSSIEVFIDTFYFSGGVIDGFGPKPRWPDNRRRVCSHIQVHLIEEFDIFPTN